MLGWTLEIRGYRIAVACIHHARPQAFARAPGVHTVPMQQAQTHIDIEAPAALDWAVLTDFFRYQRSNPLIRGVLRHLRTGAQIGIKLRSPRGEELSVRAMVQGAAATS